MRVGIISDTHGLLRPEVFRHFEGVEHILHAGDLGDEELLVELEAIAPVTCVWGNTDGPEVRARVGETARVRLADVEVAVIHGHQHAPPAPTKIAAAFPDVGLVVFGHSHDPVIERVGSVLAVNPGSAGPRRFRKPVTVALADLKNGVVTAHLVPLLPES